MPISLAMRRSVGIETPSVWVELMPKRAIPWTACGLACCCNSAMTCSTVIAIHLLILSPALDMRSFGKWLPIYGFKRSLAAFGARDPYRIIERASILYRPRMINGLSARAYPVGFSFRLTSFLAASWLGVCQYFDHFSNI